MTSAFSRMRLLPLILLLCVAITPGLAAELPRQALLGLVMEPPPEGSRPGAVVQQVVEGNTAAAIGVRVGDLIVAAGGEPISGPGEVIDFTRRKKAGDQVELTIVREGKELRLRGPATPRPLESYSGARVEYGAIPFDGGLLRDIMVIPDNVVDPPVLFLIQGFSCGSVESADPNFPHRRIAQILAQHGIATYRVEKPGVGDSAVGRQHCLEMNFERELESFRTAYRHLIDVRGVDQDRIFMLGHSMGGIQGPLLAAERPPRGVAVYGTVLRNWADYHLALHTLQSFLIFGNDPAEQMETVERNRDLFRLFYFDRLSPGEIAARRPELSEPMTNTLAWDGGERTMGRHYSFLQDQAQQRLGAAWRDTRSRVLSLYGESDMVALTSTDHILIADMVNYYRPGTARYVEIAGTDHGMGMVGDRAEVRRRTMADNTPPRGDFNPEVATTLRDWIVESMAKPPVRTMKAPAPASP
jgi:pimeloyl-ACP methyl ester carboxylesterase